MKIIGHTNNGYVVEMSNGEIDVLRGITAIYHPPKLAIGHETSIIDRWNTLVKANEHRNAISSAATLLRAQAKSLDDLLLPIVIEHLQDVEEIAPK